MKRASGVVLCLVSLALARPGRAASGGAQPFDFLFLDANARAVAMSGAYTAHATDANALLYNPAGLARIGRNELTFMHNEYVAGIHQEYLGYADPAGWGANINYLGFGAVQRTTTANPDGGLGSTSLTDVALGAGYARPLSDNVALGGAIKYIREVIDATPVTAGAVDLGILVSVPGQEKLTLGFAAQNMGPAARFSSDVEKLPFNLRAGAAYAFGVASHKSVLAFDVTKELSDAVLVSVGAETFLMDSLAVRLGYNTRERLGNGITAGVGVPFGPGSIDYAFAPMGQTGQAHRISVTWRWGGARKAELVCPQVVEAPVEAPAPPPVQASAPIQAAAPIQASARIQVAAPAPFPVTPIQPASITLGVEFDTAKHFVKPRYNEQLKKVADFLAAHPNTTAEIEGHTDFVGGYRYNMALSQRRAEAVRQALIDRFGVNGSRIWARGYGFTKPIEDNRSPEGRERNRRVMATFKAIRYWVQTGSFTDSERARDLAKTLQAAGHPAEALLLNADDPYRVWIGPYESKPEAEAELDKLAAGGNQGIVVSR